jgi:hypothetical protein
MSGEGGMRNWFRKLFRLKPAYNPYEGSFHSWSYDEYKAWSYYGEYCVWIGSGYKFFADYRVHLDVRGVYIAPVPFISNLTRKERRQVWDALQKEILQRKEEEKDITVLKDA